MKYLHPELPFSTNSDLLSAEFSNEQLRNMIGRGAVWHAHRVALVSGLQSQTAVLVRQIPFSPDHNPSSWQVTEHDLNNNTARQLAVVRSSVDAGRHLWLQIAEPAEVDNWPAGRHPAYFQPPYEQTRLEADLESNYTATSMVMKIGLRATRHLASIDAAFADRLKFTKPVTDAVMQPTERRAA